MLNTLEKGITRAITHDLRQVLMSIHGLRSHNLQWEVAESIAVNSSTYLAKEMPTTAALKELLIVIPANLQEDRKDRVLATMAGAEKKQIEGTLKPKRENGEKLSTSQEVKKDGDPLVDESPKRETLESMLALNVRRFFISQWT